MRLRMAPVVVPGERVSGRVEKRRDGEEDKRVWVSRK